MQFDITATLFAAAAAVFAVLALVTWRRRANNPGVAIALTAVMAGACWWSLADAFGLAATSETVASVASLAMFPGLGTVVAAFGFLSIAIARPQWVPSRRYLQLALIEPVAITLLAATNPWHQLVYGGPGASDLTTPAAWTYGPAFWCHAGYSYVALGLGILLIAMSCWQAPPAFRGQRITLFVASLAPIVVNVIRLAGGFREFPDPTPLGFAVTGTVMAYAIFRQDLFTFAPVARALIVDQIGDAIVAVSPAGRVLDLNPAAVALVRQMDPDAPVELIGAEASALRGGLLARPAGEAGFEFVLAGGERADYQVRSSPLIDRRRRVLGTVFVARDVTEAKAQTRRLFEANAQLLGQIETIDRLRADLVEVASRDPLTGLHNRRYLVEQFAGMLDAAERTGTELAVALIDVDRFKSINDHYGHLIGDEVLVALADRVRAHLPAGALVCRWGGEEFFVALPGATVAQGFAVADDVRRRCERDGIDVTGATVHCTVSIGLANYPAAGTSMNELFHAADVALYLAKGSGRNTTRMHLEALGRA
ncbi:histidine kinase N-terminal 7TM domain-containing diguanylate cyclase [Pengzhenrongella sicca]|uniref:Diguanylate cyclase n=1 Tax=Pengzhenrongella sicca TaxID=2819238 RepID=A0A8A4ZEG9_9MICO|nr:diguanylate cyclase [Pengzhenrongella sicca]QTE28887.1 diguanylate cyclase [Pengzhenrongella sicca]